MKLAKLLIIDDHPIFLEGIRNILQSNFPNCEVTLSNSASVLLQSVETFDLVICDMEIPGEDVVAILSDFKEQSNVPILVVSMHRKTALVQKCSEIGIEGYILKNDSEVLFDAIETVLKGELYYSSAVDALFVEGVSERIRFTTREIEVMECIAKGLSNIEISEMLFVSIETIKSHKKNIKQKTGTVSSSELLNYCIKNTLT